MVFGKLVRPNMNTNKAFGNCKNESLVESIFGSISEFARQVELNGDNFVYHRIEVRYDDKADIHWFFREK